MENKFLPYPKQFNCGGQRVEVRDVERCDDGTVGEANICAGYIEIAEKFNKSYIQSPDSRKNSSYHELVHCILSTMGEHELNDNEKFVCSFAGFLTEAMADAKFIDKEDGK